VSKIEARSEVFVREIVVDAASRDSRRIASLFQRPEISGSQSRRAFTE